MIQAKLLFTASLFRTLTLTSHLLLLFCYFWRLRANHRMLANNDWLVLDMSVLSLLLSATADLVNLSNCCFVSVFYFVIVLVICFGSSFEIEL